LAGEPFFKSRDEILQMTRRWVLRVLRHERDDKNRILPTGKPPPGEKKQPAPKNERERLRLWYRGLGWPEHRVEMKLEELFDAAGRRKGP
jgi:hypothetical protein